MKFTIVFLTALCLSHVAFAEEIDAIEERINLNTVSCILKSIDNAFQEARNFPNAINTCLNNAANLPTDVTNMIQTLTRKIKDIEEKFKALQNASDFGKLSAGVQVLASVSDVLTLADQIVQRVNAVVNNPQAKKCINNSIAKMKNPFNAIKKC